MDHNAITLGDVSTKKTLVNLENWNLNIKFKLRTNLSFSKEKFLLD